MPKETLKNLKKTKEGGKIKMLKNKKRNNANSFGCNNSSAFDISGSKYKLNIRQ